MKLDEIKINKNNPRTIKSEKMDKLKRSIEQFPKMMELRPIVIDNNKMILGGNMRYLALKELGNTEIPDEWIKFATQLTDEEKNRFIIEDNVGFGDWDWDILANEWEAEYLEEWGLDIPEMEAEVLDAKEDDYEIPDAIETDIVLGDLFQIGEHRLLCGDSTDAEQVARLMGGEKADMVFTDPPYGVSYSARTGIRSGNIRENMQMIKNDDLRGDDLNDLILNALKNCIIFTSPESAIYVCNNWHCASLFVEIFKTLNFKIDAWIVWNKDWMSVGHGDYRSNHEFILYTSRGAKFYAPKGTEHDVWTLRKLSPTNKTHTTEKPIGIPEKAIKNSSKLNQTVLDLFLGSGSTMVASHQLKRKCYGMELDPKYCQVIIDRMKKLDPDIKIDKIK